MKKVLTVLSLCIATAVSYSAVAGVQSGSQFNEWQKLANRDDLTRVNSQALSSQQLSTNIAALNQILLTNRDSVIITLPLPDGNFADFELKPSAIVEGGLNEKYPNIKTFSGHELGKPDNHGRFDITPQGFHGLFRYGKETVFIDPQYRDSDARYISYFRKDAIPLNLANMPKRLPPKIRDKSQQAFTSHALRDAAMVPQAMASRDKDAQAQATQLKTYRIAISATGEYTQFHGGTKERGLAAVITMLNRVNDVYQADLAVKLELVANNDSLIFVDPNTDPFANTDADGEANTGIIDNAIGNTSYDVGHVVGTGGGGLAALGVICDVTAKGDGVTGSPSPTGDAFNIDYVAHELGHQFGADHTFNGLTDSCDGNRADSSAFEPGSGSTVMSYAGICGQQNLQDNSNPYFHSHSIDVIQAHITTGTGSSCAQVGTTSNTNPEVNAGADYTIPARTPFVLTGSATDADGDPLSYDWQQYDLGPASASAAEQVDDGKRPLFRVWNPTSQPSRTLPRLEDILLNKLTIGETYPTTTRELNFRLMVRDGNQGLARDSMKISVVDTSQAFAVIEPAAGSSWANNSQLVTWNVANTASAPISCSKVNIQLSTNGGSSFDTDLAMGVDNDGSHEVTLTQITSNSARIKLSCADNIFFAVNNGNFSVAAGTNEQSIEITALKTPLTMDEDGELTLSTDMYQYQGLTATSLTLQAGNNYQVNGNTISPTADFNGELSVLVIAHSGSIESEAFPTLVSVTAVNDAPNAVNDASSVSQDSSNNVIDPLSNDSDIDSGDQLSLLSLNYTGQGTATIINNKISYTPAAGFSGSETITYTLQDSSKATASAVVTITVNATNTGTTGGSGSETGGSSSGGALGFWLFILLPLLGARGLRGRDL
ncbi:PPE-repeat protein [Shewanella sediminis HAW-EB3]|uniref:PPE-repeat protein n=1 Tax=Shewanella sediminis (strain HAW-EB3) TaxID=425104 RepID=A8FS22_SHESH|nr:zinc-dependent metalloprotease family protein [Shewanella sediminis]ABV35645.1 PPE-repeat protein [Shewanella sediminis HAW-EB3]